MFIKILSVFSRDMNQIVEVEVSFRKFLDLEVDDFLNLHRYISCLLSF